MGIAGTEYDGWLTVGQFFLSTSRPKKGEDPSESIKVSKSGAFRTLNNWISECDESDTHCLCRVGCGDADQSLPDRVLAVGSVETPRLQLKEISGESSKNAALNYFWGKAQNYTTTLATLDEFRHDIDESRLPKTITDAVALTRALGLEYLWVDALCIIQGNPEDWERQSSKMHQVYSNAYLTICASRAT